MYHISEETLNLFLQGKKNLTKLKVETTKETLHLTEADLWQSGLTIDRYCMSGSRVEIGSAIAAELTLNLDNSNGRFDYVSFEGAEIFVQIGAWDALEHVYRYIPCGYFTVDEPPRKLSSIALRALDRMVQFDKTVKESVFPSTPITIGDLYEWCCAQCNIIPATLTHELPLSGYIVNSKPASLQNGTLTYRRIIQWIAEINGKCAFIDWNGHLRLEWDNPTNMVIGPELRYSSDMFENEITVTGVAVEDMEGNQYLSGTDAYAFNISGNELVQHDAKALADVLYQNLNGFSYLPYSCKTKYLPHLYPLDRISYKDKKGNVYSTIVTHHTYKLNQHTEIAAKGKTDTNNGYASADPFTARESLILHKLKLDQSRQLAAQEAATLSLNQTISNAFGLYRTEEIQKDGSVKFYYHTGKTLADSNVIYTLNSGGFAWTDDWNDGKPVWNYGIDSSGNAVLRTLSAYKITADQIAAGAITAEKIAANAITADKIKAGSITADKIDATNLKVNAANITGMLTANQIDATNLKVNAANITGMLTVKGTDGKVILQAGDCVVNIGGWSFLSDRFQYKTSKEWTVFHPKGVPLYCADGLTRTLTIGVGTPGKMNFGVTNTGQLYASDIVIPSGTLWLPYTDNTLLASRNGVHLSPAGMYIQMDDTKGGGTYVEVDRILVSPRGAPDGQFIRGTGIFEGTIMLANGVYDTGSLASGAQYSTNGIQFLNSEVNAKAARIHYGTYNSGYSGMKLLSNSLILASGSAIENDQDNKIVIGNDPSAGTGVRITGYKISANKSISVDSDRNLKHDIESLEAKYADLLDLLRPVRFKYNEDKEGKFHMGFIAQEVQEAMQSVGIAADEFGGHSVGVKGTQSLAYEEFIALIVYELQRLKKQIQK